MHRLWAPSDLLPALRIECLTDQFSLGDMEEGRRNDKDARRLIFSTQCHGLGDGSGSSKHELVWCQLNSLQVAEYDFIH
jgi:hypothetical protein